MPSAIAMSRIGAPIHTVACACAVSVFTMTSRLPRKSEVATYRRLPVGSISRASRLTPEPVAMSMVPTTLGGGVDDGDVDAVVAGTTGEHPLAVRADGQRRDAEGQRVLVEHRAGDGVDRHDRVMSCGGDAHVGAVIGDDDGERVSGQADRTPPRPWCAG